jgi:CHASE3 domain sensor protein
LSIRLKLSLLISFLFVSAIFNSVYIFKLERDGDEKLIWINNTHDIMIQTEKLISALKDTETGHRGYIITDNITYLDPYYNGRDNVESIYKGLVAKRLITQNSS